MEAKSIDKQTNEPIILAMREAHMHQQAASTELEKAMRYYLAIKSDAELPPPVEMKATKEQQMQRDLRLSAIRDAIEYLIDAGVPRETVMRFVHETMFPST